MDMKKFWGNCLGVVLCLFLLSDSLRSEDETWKSAVIKEDTEFWDPNSSPEDDPATGTFQKGEVVEVKGKSIVNGTVFTYAKTKGKKAAKAGWVKANQVTIGKELPAAATSSAETPAASDSHSLPAVASKVNQMGFDILRKSAESNSNSLISPYGVWANLQILRQGAKGKSKREIDALIGAPNEGSDKSFSSNEFRSIDCFVYKNDIELTQSFTDFAKATGLEVKGSPFDDSTRVDFNDWVFEQSNKLIPDFFTPTTWNKDAQVLIANVAYFRGEWTNKFSPDMTQDADFQLNSKEKITTPMMIGQKNCPWFASETLKSEGAVLPYQGGDIAAIVLVPRELSGLPALLEGLTGDSFEKLFADLPTELSQVQSQKVTVMLPKLDLASEFSVDQALKLNSLTSNGADLSGIFETKHVKLSRIIQKTRLKVDETGTEAVAATTTEVVASSIDLDPPKVVKADHPFLLCVTHWPTRTILFACAIVDPRSTPTKD